MNIGDKKVWLVEQGNLALCTWSEIKSIHFVWNPYGDRQNNFEGIGDTNDEAINKLYESIKLTLYLESGGS